MGLAPGRTHQNRPTIGATSDRLIMFYRNRGKRAFDLSVALAAALVLSPVLALLWLLARARIGDPAFFRQERPGWRGGPFRILKLRTMADVRDPAGNLLPDAKRLTAFGRWLRRTSLDELPEVFNVLKGDMSLLRLKFPILRSLRSLLWINCRILLRLPSFVWLNPVSVPSMLGPSWISDSISARPRRPRASS